MPHEICYFDILIFFNWKQLRNSTSKKSPLSSPFYLKVEYKLPPRFASGKELAWQCRRPKRHGFDPWVGMMFWRRKWQPTPVSFPGKTPEEPGSHKEWLLWGHKESDTVTSRKPGLLRRRIFWSVPEALSSLHDKDGNHLSHQESFRTQKKSDTTMLLSTTKHGISRLWKNSQVCVGGTCTLRSRF